MISGLAATALLQPPKLDDSAIDVRIDGALDEDAWAQAAVVDDFAVVHPGTLAAPAHRTRVRVFYTQAGLYVGTWAEQPRATHVERLSAHDSWAEGDQVRIGIDPTGTGRYGYLLGVALGGSATDATLLPERQQNQDWDGPWKRATRRLADGWSAEAFLPWSMFVMPKGSAQTTGDRRTIGLYFDRWMAKRSERWSWPPLPPTRPKFLSAFQPTVIEGIEPRSQIIGYPYVAPTYRMQDEDVSVRAGFDAFWNPAAQTRLALAVMPDFAQVDADPLVINLSAFETFFPEKRPFFTEGQDLFQTGRVNLVHTRRIGAQPHLPSLATGRVIDPPSTADILAAAKVLGQAGSVRYGVMGARESSTEYDILMDDDMTMSAAAPGRSFATARLLLEGEGEGYRALGALATLVHTPDQPLAVVSALDGRLLSAGGRFQAKGQGIISRADATSGVGAWLEAVLSPAQGHEHSLVLEHYGPGLQVNDFGYLQRRDLSRITYQYDLTQPARGWLKQHSINLASQHGWNSDQQMVHSLFQVIPSVTLRNNHSVALQLSYSLPRWDDRGSHGNGVYRVHAKPQIIADYWTDRSKPWTVGARVWGVGEDLGGLSTGLSMLLRLTPSQHFELESALTVERADDWLLWRPEPQHFATYDGYYVAPQVNVSALFSPKQQLRLAVQWVGLRAQPTASWDIGPDGLLEPRMSAAPGNIEQGSLTLQLRYHYQFAPLSDLFVVYARGGELDQGSSYGALLRESFLEPSTNQLMMKIRYRFDL